MRERERASRREGEWQTREEAVKLKQLKEARETVGSRLHADVRSIGPDVLTTAETMRRGLVTP